ncbi:MAG: hypothetical protein HY303_11055 [Candidatus Wallbacteria bacterium]|nr:hypothetical protein [Candidatus Wallbacteria bacterium]
MRVVIALATLAGAAACHGGSRPEPARKAPLLTVKVLRMAGPEGPTLVTHPKQTFRDVVRCFARYEGDLWFGTYGEGLFRVGARGLERYTRRTSPLLEDRVNCLAVRGKELWIGTCAGIDVYDGKGWRAIRAGEGPAHNIYHAIKTDSHGGIWVGTTGKGLSWCSGSSGQWRTFTVSDGLAGDWVNDVLELPDGALWAACLGGVSRRGADGAWRIERSDLFPLYRNAVALARQGDSLWVGFGDCGLFMFEGGKWFRPPPEALPAASVRGLAVDRSGLLWIATESGIGTYDPARDFEQRVAGAGLEDRDIRTLYCDSETNELFAGSARGTVYRRRPGESQWKVLVRQGRLAAVDARDREEATR